MRFPQLTYQHSLSFGIIAKSLQHEEGCYLPSFEIDIEKGVREHLTELLYYKDMGSIAECVEEYGGTKENGIRMLSRHMQEMIDSKTKLGSSDYVFKLVITDVVDKETASDNGVLVLVPRHGFILRSAVRCPNSTLQTHLARIGNQPINLRAVHV